MSTTKDDIWGGAQLVQQGATITQNGENIVPPLRPNENEPEGAPSYLESPWSNYGKKVPARAEAKRMGLPVDENPHDHTVQTVAKKDEQPATAAVPADYSAMLELLNQQKPETEEERKNREKKEKRERTFAAIGDALSAFHTAYSNARGVPSMIQPNTSLTGRLQKRNDELRREREANRLAYLQNYQRLINEQHTADYQARSLSLRELEEQRRQVQLNIATRKQDWLEKYQQGMLDIKQEQLEIDRQYKSGQISKMERDAASNELRAQAAMLRAQNAGNGGGGRVGGYTTNTEIHRDERGRETGRTTTRTPAGGEPVTTTTTTTPKPVQKPTSKPVQKKAAASSKTNTNTNTKKKKTGVNWK